MKSLRLSLLLTCSLAASSIWAQFAMHIQYPHRNDFDLNLAGEVVAIHERTSVVKEQKGEWVYVLGPIEESAVYLFQDDNKLSEYIRFRKAGDIGAHVFLEYKEAAGEPKVGTARHDKSAVSFTYDKKGRFVGIQNQMGERLLSRSVFDYGRKGKSTEYILMEDQTFYFEHQLENGVVLQTSKIDSVKGLDFRATFSYNSQGLLQQAESYFTKENLPKTVLEYIYQLDEQGNWVRRLEHNQANGVYRLTERIIAYQSAVDQAPDLDQLVGLWSCGTTGYHLEVQENGRFTIVDPEEGDVYQGKWSSRGAGSYRFKVNYEDHLGAPYPFRTQSGLTAERRPGRLKLYLPGEYHFDFIHESVAPVPPELPMAIEQARWSENRFAKDPELKQEAQVPDDIKVAFDEVRGLGPDRIQACLDGRCGVIDLNGTVIIPFAYEQVDIMDMDHYRITEDSKHGVINTLGEQILDPKYESVWAEPRLGRRIIGTRLQGERYYYDLDKGDFLPFEKDQLRDWNEERWVIRGRRFVNLYDNDFNLITRDSSYNRITALTHNRYLAGGQDAYRIIDGEGNELEVFAGFLKVESVGFGYLKAFSANSQLFALFNMEGNQITEAIYEELSFCKSRNLDSTECLRLRFKPAIATFKKANGQSGSLTALGQELR